MIRLWRALPLLALAACNGTIVDDTGDTDSGSTGDGCPDGMSEARTAGLFFSRYLIDGLAVNVNFEERDIRSLDRPAACVSSDGKSVDFIYLLDSEPFGRIAMDVPGPGFYGLNENDGYIALELYVYDTTFDNGDFLTGTWGVNSASRSGFDSDYDGTTLADNVSTSMRFTITATP